MADARHGVTRKQEGRLKAAPSHFLDGRVTW